MSITTELQRLAQAKEDIETLLTFRGVTLRSNTKTEDMPELIANIIRIEKPYYENLEAGWVDSSTYGATATWKYQEPQGNLTDVYRLKASHKYLWFVCRPVGNRTRVMTTTTDPVGSTVDITGFSIYKNDDANAGYTWITDQTPSRVFIPQSDCYLLIFKDATYDLSVKTYVMDMTYMDNPGSPTWVEP